MPFTNVKLAMALSAVVVALPVHEAGADGTDRLLGAIVDGIVNEYLPQEPRYDDRHRREWRGADIPPGHYPPPGRCRVWYPDRPPGHQPPPTSCNVRVPRGAILVQG